MDDRRGNPSDPAEEAERIRKAYENVDNWQRKYGGEFSGSVKMSVGSGPVYEVPIGQPEIAQKIVSRPIAPPTAVPLIESAESAPEPSPLPQVQPQPSWLRRLFDLLFRTGEYR